MTQPPKPVPVAPVPPSAPLPLLRYIHTARNNVIATFHADVYQQPVVESKLWKLHTFIVNDPAAIRHILIDNAGNYIKGEIEQRIASAAFGQVFTATQKWRNKRRTMSSIVDYRSIPGNCSTILEATQSLLDRWSRREAVIEVDAEMSQLTLEIITRLVFPSDFAEMASAMESTFLSNESDPPIDLLDFVPLLNEPWAAYKRFCMRRRFRLLTASIDRLIAKRSREKMTERHDFLGLLMRERDPTTGRLLSAEKIHAQIITVVGAGHHTAALALTWIWYLLSLHPVEEARLHAELQMALAGRTPDIADIPRLAYTRMLIEESLRLYPPVPVMAWRGALADDEVCGVKIPRGATVTIAPWVLHRHAQLWENPAYFIPERFSAVNSQSRSRYAYLPFGTGPRVCIGASFAMMEMTLILATIAQRFRLHTQPSHPVEPRGLVMLRPRYGMKAILERRS